MKRIAYWTMMMLLGAPAVFATERNMPEDPSAESALITWRDPSAFQVGLSYTRISRQVDLGGVEWALRGDSIDVAMGFSPARWLLFYGQAGGSKARLQDRMVEEANFGAGGLLGARINLWQLYEGVQATAWRLTLQLAGQYTFRTARDHGDGDLQWGEALVMLPLDYHLYFARSFRNSYMAEFQSVDVHIGPAFSKLDGTWTRQGVEKDFEEVQAVGVVGGVDLWLLENLSFGARVESFDGTSMQLNVRYRF
jgi:hypothetical protein